MWDLFRILLDCLRLRVNLRLALKFTHEIGLHAQTSKSEGP